MHRIIDMQHVIHSAVFDAALGMVKLTRSLAKVGKQIFMKKQNECLRNYRITATWVRSHCLKWAGQSNLGDVCLYPESIRVGWKWI